jgi:hypothetical protein
VASWSAASLKGLLLSFGLSALYDKLRLLEPIVNAAHRSDPVDVFNVQTYGANGDEFDPAHDPIMDAFDDAVEAVGGIVYFPPGFYNVSRPLLFRDASGIQFRGIATDAVLIQGNGYQGPTIVFLPAEADYPDVETDSCPLTGGAVLPDDPGGDQLLRLDDIVIASINDLSAITVDWTFRTGDETVLQFVGASYGKRSASGTFANGGVTSAIALLIQGGDLKARITVAGEFYDDILIGTVSPDTDYWAAVQYDTTSGLCRTFMGEIPGGSVTVGATEVCGASLAWSAVTAYVEDDRVLYDSKSFKAGPGASTNVTPNGHAAFNAATSYSMGDLITHEGQTWKAVQAQSNRAVVEGDDWTLVWGKMHITQGPFEEMTLSGIYSEFPQTSPISLIEDGWVGPMRISSVARYGAGGPATAPSAVWATDSDTRLQIDFTDLDGPFVKADIIGGSASGWLLIRRVNASVPAVERITIEEMTIHGNTGLGMIGVIFTGNHLRNLHFLSFTTEGLVLWNNCFSVHSDDVKFTNSGQRGASLVQAHISGAGEHKQLSFLGGAIQHAIGPGSGAKLTVPFYAPSEVTRVCLHAYLLGGNLTIDEAHFDQENVGPLWEVPMSLSGCSLFQMIAGEVEGHGVSSVRIDGGGMYRFAGTRFNHNTDAPYVFDIVDSPLHRVTVDSGQQYEEPFVPWSSNGWHVIRHGDQSESPIYDNGNSGTADTITGSNGTSQKSTLTGNVTFTLTLNDGDRVEHHILTGAGSFTVAWTTVDSWVGGSTPTITATASKLDIFEYWKTNGKVYGKVIGQNLTP